MDESCQNFSAGLHFIISAEGSGDSRSGLEDDCPINLRKRFTTNAEALSMLKYATGTIKSVSSVPVIVPKSIVIPSERHIVAASSRLSTIGRRPRVFISIVISSGLSLSQHDSNITRNRFFLPTRRY